MIDRYLSRSVLAITLLVGLILLAISTFLSLVAELEDMGDGNYGLLAVLRYVGLMLPEGLYLLAPLIALLGTLMGLGGLTAHHELTAMRAAGMSILRIAMGVARAGLVLGVAAFLIGEFVIPAATLYAKEQRALDRHGPTARNTERGVWLRDGRHYVHIGNLIDEETLQALELFEVADSGTLQSTTFAERGAYRDGAWAFTGVRRTDFTAAGTQVTSFDTSELPGVLTERFSPSVLKLFVLEADSLSARGLYRYMRYLEDNSLDSDRAEVEFWRKIAVPFTVLVMMLVGVPFVINPSRQSGAGQRLFIGVLVGVGFFVANEVTASTGVIYGLPPILSAFLPTVLVGALAAFRLQRMR